MQKAIYYNVANGGYAVQGGKVTDIPFIKSVTENYNETSADQYANGMLVGSVKGVAKKTGEIGVTAEDTALEEAVGFKQALAGGVIASVQGAKPKRIDLHYSYNEIDEDGKEIVVKAWKLNVELGRGAKTHNTRTDSVDIGAYTYPYTCYGRYLKAAEGDEDYVDENGCKRMVFEVEARPGDTGYETFFDAVPVLKAAE
jgi:hypothetical protein